MATTAMSCTALGRCGLSAAVQAQDKAVTFKTIRVVHNVTVSGMKGMYLYATFDFNWNRPMPMTLYAFFHDDDSDGAAVEATQYTPPHYRTRDGKVATQVSFTPSIEVPNEWQLFMPYEAFTKFSGSTWDYKYYLRLNDNREQQAYGRSGWYKVRVKTP